LRRDTALQLRAKSAHGGDALAKRLGKWAAGGVAQQVVLSSEEELQERIDQTLNTHRESVIWFLRRRLEACAEVQGGMMETRLAREVERSKSVLYKTKGSAVGMGVALEEQAGKGLSGHGRGKGSVGGANGYNDANGVAMGDGDREKIETELTPEQLQLFAQENNEMLKHYEDTLDQVR
jgi:syntaxin 18